MVDRLKRVSFRIKDSLRFRAGNKIRKANNYLTLSEIYYLAKKLNLTILDPYGVLIGKSVTLGKGNTIYSNVIIRGNVIIGNNCEIGFGGGAVIAAPKGKIKVGSNVRITNGAQILDNVILEDGSQVLGPVTLTNIVLKGGDSYKHPDPNDRGAVAKGGIRIKVDSGVIPQGKVVDTFRYGTEIEPQASKHQPPNLEEIYREKIIQGRIWPLIKQEEYLRNALEFDRSGKVIFEKGRPSYNRIENLYFYLGMPLPSKEITQRIVAFRQALAEAGHFSPHDFYPNLPGELHVTLFDYRWNKDKDHPIVKDPEKLQRFIESVRDIFREPMTIYFKEFALFDNGAVVACGYPEFFPDSSESNVDLIRKNYLNLYPEGSAPNIAHITIGRFLRQITEEEHGIVLGKIDEFNQAPLGSIPFDKINVFHEKIYWLSDGEDLATISIDSKDPEKKKIFMLKAIAINFKEIPFDPQTTGTAIRRIQEVSIKGEREASGYAVWIKDPSKIRLFYHEGMLSYDFSKHFIIDPKVDKEKAEKFIKEGKTFKEVEGKKLKGITEGNKSIAFACNGETDNMWASNSVIIVDGKVIKRKAPGVEAKETIPLDGTFSFFVFDPGRVRIENLTFKQGELKRPLTFKNGIRGPVLIRKDQDQDQTHRLLQVKPNTPNTEQNDVLWDPKVNQAAMTAVGSNARGEIVFVSLKGDPDKGNEIILSDVVKVLRELGAVNAVLLGLSGDVQQYLPLPGRESPFLIAKPRTGSTMEKMFSEGRPLSSAIIVER